MILQIKEYVGEVCAANNVDIERGSMSLDTLPFFITVLLSVSVSEIVQYLKGRTIRKLQQEFVYLKVLETTFVVERVFCCDSLRIKCIGYLEIQGTVKRKSCIKSLQYFGILNEWPLLWLFKRSLELSASANGEFTIGKRVSLFVFSVGIV